MTQPEVRKFEVGAQSTAIFGRVLCSARHHHFIADGPVQNGCPGEALTPPELFLSGIASCGVELIQVLARAQDVPLETVSVAIEGTLDRANPVRPDVTVLNSVRLQFHLSGVRAEQAEQLVEAFKRR